MPNETLVREYIEQLGLCAVYLLPRRTGSPVAIGATRDVVEHTRKIREDDSALSVDDIVVFWATDDDAATYLLDQFAAHLRDRGHYRPRGLYEIHIMRARREMLALASSLGVALETGDTIHANALATIDAVNRAVVDLQAQGGLKEINRQYKAFRLSRERSGESVPGYSAWLNAYKRNVVAGVALHMRDFMRPAFGAPPLASPDFVGGVPRAILSQAIPSFEVAALASPLRRR